MVMSEPLARTAPQARSVSVLGVTGSVGRSTVALLAENPELYRVEAVVAGRDAQALARTAIDLGARLAVLHDEKMLPALADALAGTGIEAAAGHAAVIEAASRPVDWTMAAISGTAGLLPTLAAVRRGGAIALANKECLVSAGAAFLAEAERAGALILPVDSEHNAIAQALCSGRPADVARIVLTASGGPFRTWDLARMTRARPEDALRHPTWSMGRKITVDSATMMNKALELIEAHHLFKIGGDRLDVLVHPQSIVHGMVQWRDGSLVAGLAPADMRVPIAHCLGFPKRIATAVSPLDLARIGTLSFENVDAVRFPAIGLARQAMAAGGHAATVLNAANEIAVDAFLAGRIAFTDIAAVVQAVMDKCGRMGEEASSIAHALDVDHEARHLAQQHLPLFAGRVD